MVNFKKMTQHITIGFNKPQAMIVILLGRSGLDSHGIQINNDNFDIMINVMDNHLEIDGIILVYPLLISNVIVAIKKFQTEKHNHD